MITLLRRFGSSECLGVVRPHASQEIPGMPASSAGSSFLLKNDVAPTTITRCKGMLTKSSNLRLPYPLRMPDLVISVDGIPARGSVSSRRSVPCENCPISLGFAISTFHFRTVAATSVTVPRSEACMITIVLQDGTMGREVEC